MNEDDFDNEQSGPSNNGSMSNKAAKAAKLVKFAKIIAPIAPYIAAVAIGALVILCIVALPYTYLDSVRGFITNIGDAINGVTIGNNNYTPREEKLYTKMMDDLNSMEQNFKVKLDERYLTNTMYYRALGEDLLGDVVIDLKDTQEVKNYEQALVEQAVDEGIIQKGNPNVGDCITFITVEGCYFNTSNYSTDSPEFTKYFLTDQKLPRPNYTAKVSEPYEKAAKRVDEISPSLIHLRDNYSYELDCEYSTTDTRTVGNEVKVTTSQHNVIEPLGKKADIDPELDFYDYPVTYSSDDEDGDADGIPNTFSRKWLDSLNYVRKNEFGGTTFDITGKDDIDELDKRLQAKSTAKSTYNNDLKCVIYQYATPTYYTTYEKFIMFLDLFYINNYADELFKGPEDPDRDFIVYDYINNLDPKPSNVRDLIMSSTNVKIDYPSELWQEKDDEFKYHALYSSSDSFFITGGNVIDNFSDPNGICKNYDRSGITNIISEIGLPMGGGTLTSGFGKRIHPVKGGVEGHKGMDIGVPTGTHLFAVYDGVLTAHLNQGGIKAGFGYYLRLSSTIKGVSYTFTYGHLNGFAPGVSVGGTYNVKKGDLIGFVGSTGTSTGPHLHFEMKVGTPATGFSSNLIDPTGVFCEAPASAIASSNKLIDFANSFIGKPVSFKNDPPASFTNFGFVKYVYQRTQNINLGSSVQNLYDNPSSIKKGGLKIPIADIKSGKESYGNGDILVFGNGDVAEYVGIYSTGNKVIMGVYNTTSGSIIEEYTLTKDSVTINDSTYHVIGAIRLVDTEYTKIAFTTCDYDLSNFGSGNSMGGRPKSYMSFNALGQTSRDERIVLLNNGPGILMTSKNDPEMFAVALGGAFNGGRGDNYKFGTDKASIGLMYEFTFDDNSTLKTIKIDAKSNNHTFGPLNTGSGPEKAPSNNSEGHHCVYSGVYGGSADYSVIEFVTNENFAVNHEAFGKDPTVIKYKNKAITKIYELRLE